MYKFKVLKSGAISVYKDNNLCCIIPSDFSLIRPGETVMDFCKRVFI